MTSPSSAGIALVTGAASGLGAATAALLAAERTALNLLQQLSGVATLTARFVRAGEAYFPRLIWGPRD